MKQIKYIYLPLIAMLFFHCMQAQMLTEAEAINGALKNNLLIKASEYEIASAKQQKKTGTDLGRLSAVYMRGQYNTIESDNNISLTQTIPFPGTIAAQVKLGEEHVKGANLNHQLVRNNLVRDVKTTYNHLLFLHAHHTLLLTQDTIYNNFARAAAVKFKTGESNLLETTSAETQLQETRNLIRQNLADIYVAQKQLQTLTNSTNNIDVIGALSKRSINLNNVALSADNNIKIKLLDQQVQINQQSKRIEQNKLLPDFSVGYFNQTLIGFQNTTGSDRYFGKSDRFQGFTVGVSFPLWFGPQASRAKALSLAEESSRLAAGYYRKAINTELEKLLREVDKNKATLDYYETNALKNSVLIISQAQKAFDVGEIGYVEYLQSIRTALSIKFNYIQAIHQFNLSVIEIEYLTENP